MWFQLAPASILSSESDSPVGRVRGNWWQSIYLLTATLVMVAGLAGHKSVAVRETTLYVEGMGSAGEVSSSSPGGLELARWCGGGGPEHWGGLGSFPIVREDSEYRFQITEVRNFAAPEDRRGTVVVHWSQICPKK